MEYQSWWNNLEQQWKDAFKATFFQQTTEPTTTQIEQLKNAVVLRMAGPRAPYPNMSFELTNLSGLKGLTQLQILVVTHHQVTDIAVVQYLHNLKSLFLFNNQIECLDAIKDLTNLEQLYVQCNKIGSIKPLQSLTKLKEVYVSYNMLCSLEGLTEAHSDTLTTFFCTPNEGIKQKEIIYTENQLGIRCKGY